MPWTRMVLATVLLALTGAVEAQGKLFVGPENGIAITPTDVIGVSTDDANMCTTAEGFSSENQIAVSHDRGASWQPAACLSSMTDLMLDPVTGAVSTVTNTQRYNQATSTYDFGLRLVTLDANGNVAGGRDIADPNPRSFKTAAISGGTVFVGDREANGNITALRSISPSGEVGACGTPPGDSARLLAMPNGVLLGLNDGSNPDKILQAVSHDACKTWTKTPKEPGAEGDCSSIKLYSPVRAYLGCAAPEANAPTAYALEFDDPSAWKKAGLGGVGFDYYDQGPDIFVPADETKIQIQPDRFALPSWPAGWAAQAPIAGLGVDPPGFAAGAFTFVNNRYRKPLGLPDIGWSVLAGRAAQAHANYYAKNGFSGHTEKKGKPGFTGRDPGDRCAKVKLHGGCTEVAFSEPDIDKAVAGWLATPLHGAPFLYSSTMGLGSSKGGSVGDSGEEQSGGYTIWLDAAPNTPGSAIKMWPADGMTGIPTHWWGAESPDPLSEYQGDKSDVGPTMFATSEQPMRLTLRKAGAKKPIPLMPIYAKRGRRRLTIFSGYGAFMPFFPTHQLATSTRYVLTGKVAGVVHTWTFTTAKNPTATA